METVKDAYFYKHKRSRCLEHCPIDDTVSIGSSYCRDCKNCTAKGKDWIVCEVIKKIK